MSERRDDFSRAFDQGPRTPTGLGGRVVDFVRAAAQGLADVPVLDVFASDDGVARIDFGSGRTEASGRRARRHADQAREELSEFFAAERGYFTVPLDLSTTRPFQRAVLDAALRIPVGEVRSYRWIAESAGNSAAVRAAGSALRTNPVPLIVPCHRVVRSDGSLGGYAGGLPLKQRLLLLEKVIPALVGIEATRRVCRVGCPMDRDRAESDRVFFSSLESARAAGYRPCRRCRPSEDAFAVVES